MAAWDLESRGWVILDRNYRDGPREIDLVAARHEVLAFVEVKTRATVRFGDPFETISWRKRKELETAARTWLRRHPGRWPVVRFDAISILWPPGGGLRLRYLPDAWRPGEVG